MARVENIERVETHMEDTRRLQILMKLMHVRLGELGLKRFLDDTQYAGILVGASDEEVAELCAEVTSVRPMPVPVIEHVPEVSAPAPTIVPQPSEQELSQDLVHVITSITTDTGEVRRLEDIEAEVIRFALVHYKGWMSEVARRLGIGRSTLYRRVELMEEQDRALADAAMRANNTSPP